MTRINSSDSSTIPETANTTFRVPFGGRTYPVQAYVPAHAKGRSLPLVLNLHGSGSDGPSQMRLSGLADIADEEAFVVVAPTGDIPVPASRGGYLGGWAWNVPGVPIASGEYPAPDARNDIDFLKEVVNVVSAELQTDPLRVYATGFSGGARMVSALALAHPGTFAAIAPVAGLRAGPPHFQGLTRSSEESAPLRIPVPVVTFHGDADPVNPFVGNSDERWGYSLPCASAEWARLNGCATGPTSRRINEFVTLNVHANGLHGAEVHVYVIEGGGHDWPGAVAPLWPPAVDHQLNAARIISKFFAQHALHLDGVGV